MAPPPPPPQDQINKIQSKPLPNLVYKSLLIIIFVALLPLFPSQAPEFINHSIFTRSWELLHLLFVGITISYGLFSRRNNDIDHDFDKDLITSSKPDTPTTYISRLLHVSSVFDDDDNNNNNNNTSSVSDENTFSKVQTWSSQYSQAEPVVMKRSSSSSSSFKESVVLPSPIPWRSRSGRMAVSMEVKEKEKEKEITGKVSQDTIVLKKKKSSTLSVTPPPPPPPPPLPLSLTRVGKSVRTFRSLNDIDFDEHKMMKKEVVEKVIVESDDDDDDSDVNGEIEEVEEEEEEKSPGSGEEVEEEVEDEHEVDKKADEFIAKFREQIRLQRIESIKKSSGQRSAKSP